MIVHYTIARGGATVATATTLPNGKCIVAWPTSTIVYDSEQAARDVHVKHMAGRGERTRFLFVVTDVDVFRRGWHDGMQDDCEGCPFASLGAGIVGDPLPLTPPEYITKDDTPVYIRGYLSYWNETPEDYTTARSVGAK